MAHFAQVKNGIVMDAYKNFKVGIDYDTVTKTLNVNFNPITFIALYITEKVEDKKIK